MRAFKALLAACVVAFTWAQDANEPVVPSGGLSAVAGQPLELNWTPGTGGIISLYLLRGSSNDLSNRVTIASAIHNSGSYTWPVPSDIAQGSDYTIEIVTEDSSSGIPIVNYWPTFSIQGANGSGSGSASTSTTTIIQTVLTTQATTVTVSQPNTVTTLSYATGTTTVSNVGSSVITIFETETITATITQTTNPARVRRSLHKRDQVTVTALTTQVRGGTVTVTNSYDVTASSGYLSTAYLDSTALSRITSTTTITITKAVVVEGTSATLTSIIGTSSTSKPTTAGQASAAQESNTSSSNSSTEDRKSNNTNTGAIAGGVVGGVVAIALIAGLIWFLIRKKRRQLQPNLPEVQRFPVEPKGSIAQNY